MKTTCTRGDRIRRERSDIASRADPRFPSVRRLQFCEAWIGNDPAFDKLHHLSAVSPNPIDNTNEAHIEGGPDNAWIHAQQIYSGNREALDLPKGFDDPIFAVDLMCHGTDDSATWLLSENEASPTVAISRVLRPRFSNLRCVVDEIGWIALPIANLGRHHLPLSTLASELMEETLQAV